MCLFFSDMKGTITNLTSQNEGRQQGGWLLLDLS